MTNEESENHFLGILSTLVSTLASFSGWGFCPIKRCCRAGVMHLRMASPHWSAHCSYSLFGIGILLCKEMPCQECDEGVWSSLGCPVHIGHFTVHTVCLRWGFYSAMLWQESDEGVWSSLGCPVHAATLYTAHTACWGWGFDPMKSSCGLIDNNIGLRIEWLWVQTYIQLTALFALFLTTGW